MLINLPELSIPFIIPLLPHIMDKYSRTIVVVLTLFASLILGTYSISDSFAQGNATTADNQSAGANATGVANQTALEAQSAGQISGLRG